MILIIVHVCEAEASIGLRIIGIQLDGLHQQLRYLLERLRIQNAREKRASPQEAIVSVNIARSGIGESCFFSRAQRHL